MSFIMRGVTYSPKRFSPLRCISSETGVTIPVVKKQSRTSWCMQLPSLHSTRIYCSNHDIMNNPPAPPPSE